MDGHLWHGRAFRVEHEGACLEDQERFQSGKSPGVSDLFFEDSHRGLRGISVIFSRPCLPHKSRKIGIFEITDGIGFVSIEDLRQKTC